MSDQGYSVPRGTIASEQQQILPEFAVRPTDATRTKTVYYYETYDTGKTDARGNPLMKQRRKTKEEEVAVEYIVYFPNGSMGCTAKQIEELGLHRRPRMVDMESGDIVGQSLPDLAAMHDAQEEARAFKKRGR